MTEAAASGWRAKLAAYAHPSVRTMLFLGFASGLPFPLVLTTLSARLRQAGIDRTTIGLFSLVGLAYSLKFFWSPVVDRIPLPGLSPLGQRRSWMLAGQLGVIAGLVAMALHDPAAGALQMAWLAVFTAFCAATQDIAVDAYRIESSTLEWQGMAVAAYQVGYQVALICGGAGALIAASGYGWGAAYLAMAACMAIGPLTTLLVREPVAGSERQAAFEPLRLQATIARLDPRRLILAIMATALTAAVLWSGLAAARQSTALIEAAFGAILVVELLMLATLRVAAFRPVLEWLTASVVLPLVDFFERNGRRSAIAILLLVLTYRLNYTTMGVAANTFYLDLGYTLDQIAVVSKVYGILMTLAGALAAGLLVRRIGMLPTMLLGLLLLSAANLFYGYMASVSAQGPLGTEWLAAAVSLDNVGNGIAGTAFIAYMSSLTSSAFTATQYALFGTLWSLPAKTIASQWGAIVDRFGYPPFFVYTALIALPALIMILWFMRQPVAPRPAISGSA
ncbi:MAG: MFS transporter [Nevskia sp.]